MEFTAFGYTWTSSNLWVSPGDDGGFSFGTNRKDGKSSSGSIVLENDGFGLGVYEWRFEHPVFDHAEFSFGIGCGNARIVCACGDMAVHAGDYRKNIIETSIHPCVTGECGGAAPACKTGRVFRWYIKDTKPNRFFLIWSDRAVMVFYNSHPVMHFSGGTVNEELGGFAGRMSPYFTEGFKYADGEVNRIPEHMIRDARLSYFRYTPF